MASVFFISKFASAYNCPIIRLTLHFHQDEDFQFNNHCFCEEQDDGQN